MVLGIPEAPDMPHHQRVIRYAELRPDGMTHFAVIAVRGQIDGIGPDSDMTAIRKPPAEYGDSCLSRAGQAHITCGERSKRQPHQAGRHSLKPRVHSGAAGMRYGDSHSRGARYRQIYRRRAGHMSVYGSPFPAVGFEQLVYCPAVLHDVTAVKPGHAVYPCPQRARLLLVLSMLLTVYQEIQLHPLSVHEPV